MKSLLKQQDKLNNSWTILHYTSQLGFVSVMSYIANNCNSLDYNKISNDGKTPLHIAIESLNLNMVKFLIYNKASLYMRDNKGKTSYQLLVDKKLTYLVQSKMTESSSEGTFKKKTVNISIHQVEEENIQGMFRGIRSYFVEKLQPKIDNNSSVLDPPSSVASSSFVESQYTEESKHKVMDYKPKTVTNLGKNITSREKSNASSIQRKKLNLKSTGKKSRKISKKVGPKSFSVIKLLGTGSFGEVFLVSFPLS